MYASWRITSEIKVDKVKPYEYQHSASHSHIQLEAKANLLPDMGSKMSSVN